MSHLKGGMIHYIVRTMSVVLWYHLVASTYWPLVLCQTRIIFRYLNAHTFVRIQFPSMVCRLGTNSFHFSLALKKKKAFTNDFPVTKNSQYSFLSHGGRNASDLAYRQILRSDDSLRT